MKTLRETVAEFGAAGKAVAHFNVSDSNQLKAIAAAAKETGLPAIIGLSEGEREFFPIKIVRAMLDAYRAEGIELFLNADHTYSVEKVKQAIDDGADSAIFDGAKLGFDENAAQAKQCVEYARAAGRDVVIEAELGYIGQSSKVLTELPAGAALTPEMMTGAADAKKFVDATGVDMFAPAVGNIHGMLGLAKDPALNIERVKEIHAAVSSPLVLHGASGNTEDDIRNAIKAGISIVHINTELRVAYKEGLKKGLASEEVAPYKFLAPAVADMTTYLASRMKLFAGQ